jgi:uncharacterized protein with PIN domain
MAAPARFVVDAMLGSLARKLRIFGFDTLYFREGADQELERLARAEDRAIVTSDRALAAHASARGITVIEVSGKTDRARLRSLALQARLASVKLAPAEPRCAACNSLLQRLGRAAAAGRVPESVRVRHRLFFSCARCGKWYWRGGHWTRLRGLSSLIDQR